MAAFSKLLKSTGGTLARMQAELDALRAADEAASKLSPLQRAAKAQYALLTDPVRMYHGSPHVFDEFDFDSNLLRGEGAVAFGPGGYTTGSEDLGREYARNLYERWAEIPHDAHPKLRQALADNPNAIAEYLRATTIANARRKFGMYSPSLPYQLPAVEQRKRLDQPRTFLQSGNWSWFGRDEPKFIPPRAFQRGSEGLQAYYDSMRRDAGINIFDLPTRIGKGGIDPETAAKYGERMRGVATGLVPPRLFTRELSDVNSLSMPGPTRTRLGLALGEHDYGIGKRLATNERWNYNDDTAIRRANPLLFTDFYWAGDNPKRQANLNAIARFQAGKGPARYSASMTPRGGGTVDLFNPMLPAGAEGFERRLYKTYGPSFADMLSYDWPLDVNTPRVLGALESIAAAKGKTLTPDMTGERALGVLGLMGHENAAAKKAALRDAGLPAMYFLRGGRRGGGAPTGALDPFDFNYVIFDDEALARPDWEKFSSGGPVQ